MARLSPQERTFFEMLFDRFGKPVPLVDLLNAADSDGNNEVAKVVVCHLRRKLGVDIHFHRAGLRTAGAYSLESI